MRQQFNELKNKPSKDFQSSKWLRHFELWYKKKKEERGKKQER
ncbi:hypothetical protein [Pseudanabaena sp. UWO310]|nr:hypothetical protein [Pseudanabaena sp. UWO310]